MTRTQSLAKAGVSSLAPAQQGPASRPRSGRPPTPTCRRRGRLPRGLWSVHWGGQGPTLRPPPPTTSRAGWGGVGAVAAGVPHEPPGGRRMRTPALPGPPLSPPRPWTWASSAERTSQGAGGASVLPPLSSKPALQLGSGRVFPAGMAPRSCCGCRSGPRGVREQGRRAPRAGTGPGTWGGTLGRARPEPGVTTLVLRPALNLPRPGVPAAGEASPSRLRHSAGQEQYQLPPHVTTWPLTPRAPTLGPHRLRPWVRVQRVDRRWGCPRPEPPPPLCT